MVRLSVTPFFFSARLAGRLGSGPGAGDGGPAARRGEARGDTGGARPMLVRNRDI